ALRGCETMNNNKNRSSGDSAREQLTAIHSAADSRFLLELLQHPACVADSTGEILLANSSWRRRAGAADDISPYENWSHTIAAEDRANAMAQLLTCVMSGAPTQFECRLQDANGQFQWHLMDLRRYRDDTQKE